MRRNQLNTSGRNLQRVCKGRSHKNEMRYSQQAESSAIPFSHKSPKLSIGWQPRMYTQKLPILYPDNQLAVSLITGQHTISFHQSRTLANAVPLGFCFGGFSSTAGYAPATRLSFRRTASPPLAGPLPKGTTRFYPSGSRKPRDFLQLSLSAPTQGVIKISSRLPILSPGRYRTVRRSLRRSQKP